MTAAAWILLPDTQKNGFKNSKHSTKLEALIQSGKITHQSHVFFINQPILAGREVFTPTS